MEIRCVPAYSIVRLPDGRLGVVHKDTGVGMYWVKVDEEVVATLLPWTDVEVVEFVEEYALLRVRALQNPVAADPVVALHDVNTWAHSLPNLEEAQGSGCRDALNYFVEEIWPIVDAALAQADREYVA